jgi:hypothetical protein
MEIEVENEMDYGTTTEYDLLSDSDQEQQCQRDHSQTPAIVGDKDVLDVVIQWAQPRA